MTNKNTQILTEWRLATGQAVESVNNLAKSIRAEQAHERKLDLIRAELDKRTGKLTQQTKMAASANKLLNSSMVTAVTSGALLAKGFTSLVGAIKASGAAYRDYVGNIGEFPSLAQRVADSFNNMVPDTAVAKVIEMGTVNGWTQKQIENTISLSLKYARIMKVDFTTAVNTVSEALVSGKGFALKRIGIVIPKVADEQERLNNIWEQSAKIASGVSKETGNASEKFEQMRNEQVRLTAEYGKYVDKLERGWMIVISGWGRLFDKISDMGKSEVEKQREYAAAVSEIWARASQSLINDIDRQYNANLLKQQKFDESIDRQLAAIDAKWAARNSKKKVSGTKAGRKKTDLERFDSLTGLDATESQKAGLEILKELDKSHLPSHAENMRDLADAISEITLQSRLSNPAIERQAELMLRSAQAAGVARKEIGDGLAVAVQDFSGSIWGAVDAAIQGEAGFGEVMLNAAKQVALGLASQLTIKGTAALWEAYAMSSNPFTAAAAPGYYAQASTYFSGAAIVGGMGLAVSAATAGGRGGGGTSAGAARSSAGMTTYRPEAGKRVEQQQQKVIVNVYMGDSRDPSAALLMTKQVETAIKSAA